MRDDIKPGNWDSAAALVVNAIADACKTHEIAEKKKEITVNKYVDTTFNNIVEIVFHAENTDKKELEEMFMNLAVAGLHGYSLVSNETHTQSAGVIYHTVLGKQKMYGHGNIARFEIPGIVIRMNDKLERLKNLRQFNGPVLFEPVQDTWLDICGYSIIAIMWLRGWFLLDIKKPDAETSITSGE
jgi:hypothetical protein